MTDTYPRYFLNYQLISIFILKIIFMYIEDIETEMHHQRVTPWMSKTTKIRPSQNQESWTLSKSSMWVSNIQLLEESAASSMYSNRKP